jgi:hypothetical protein
MSRPSLDIAVESGLAGWDADLENLFDVFRANPWPVFQHGGSPGNETDLEAAFPAAENDRCIIAVQHSLVGWCLMVSDGASWHVMPKRADAVDKIVIGSPAPTTTAIATKLNELIDALRASGALTPSSP